MHARSRQVACTSIPGFANHAVLLLHMLQRKVAILANERATAVKHGTFSDEPPEETARKLYGKIRRGFNNALACDLRNARATEQYYHVRGRALPPHTPTRR